MVLKGVNWVHNDQIRSNGPEQSQMGTQYKNWVKWSWKESIGYTMINSIGLRNPWISVFDVVLLKVELEM